MLERFLPLLAAAVIAVAVTILSTGGVPSPFASGTDGRTDVDARTSGAASAPTDPTSVASDETALRLHLLLPASLRPGGTRQLILQLSGPALVNMGDDDLIEVRFSVQEPHAVWVRPEHHILPRRSLQRTRFELGLHADVPCDAELGNLHVAVRDLAEDGAEGEATVAMPPVNCTDPPASSPETVHITDPVCGDDWREELEALKDGDELDPERCTEERWGQEPGSGEGRRRARAAPQVEAPEEDASEETAEEESEEASEESEEAHEGTEEAAEEPSEEPAGEAEMPAEGPAQEDEGPGEEGQESGSEEPSNEAPEGASEERGETQEPPDEGNGER